MHRFLYALDVVGGSSSSSATTLTAEGGSQIAQKGGQITNPNSFAIGAKGSYVAPGSTYLPNFKGDLTIQGGSGIDADTLGELLQQARSQDSQQIAAAPSTVGAPVGPAAGDPGSAIVADTTQTEQPTTVNQLLESAKKNPVILAVILLTLLGAVWFFLRRR